MTVLEACAWLEETSLALMVTESTWGFSILVGLHLLGLTFSVGLVIWFDLRLLGLVLTNCRVSMVYRYIKPLMFTGFALMFLTGGMLFAGYAVSAYNNFYFRIKLVALILAGINVVIYHLVNERRFSHLDSAAHQPLPAKMAGIISLLLWAIVIMAGRMMSYTLYTFF